MGARGDAPENQTEATFMMRRVHLTLFFLIFCASAAWPKWKEEEQKYLDDQFRTLQDQVQALKTQVDTLNAHIVELRQNQAQLQSAMVRQLRALQDSEQLLSAMRMGGEENFSTLKSAIGQLRAETQKSFNALVGQPAAAAVGTAEVITTPRPTPAAATTPQVTQGYITVVEGNSVTVDLGAARGIRQGSRLAVYKATDPNTRVGLLEVTQVVDRDNSKAQIVQMNQGIRPEFSDIVRVE